MPSVRATSVPLTLHPARFVFWVPEGDRALPAGDDQPEIPLPHLPLPLNRDDLKKGEPPENAAIGQGLYDYLRQFPDCPHNTVYAGLLRDAFPHFLTDLAAQAVLLDAKEVETSHLKRKLTALKVLALIEPDNVGLLHQLSRGFYDLALHYEELADCRQYLLQAMRYGQELVKMAPTDPHALHLLAEIDIMFGDYPGAEQKWSRALDHLEESSLQEYVESRRTRFRGRPYVASNLVDDLEAVHKAMELYAAENYSLALAILERLEEEGRFAAELPSADYYYLLGACRLREQLPDQAEKALQRALAIDTGHAPAQQALQELRGEESRRD